MMRRSGVTMTKDGLSALAERILELSRNQVVVGVPAEKADRTDEETPINNAQIAYIQTMGAPEINLAARPFLQPGIRKKRQAITDELKAAATAILDGQNSAASRGLARAGQTGASAAQNEIAEGLQPPLQPETVARRRIRRAGSKYRRKAKDPPDTTPLFDTGQLLRSITYAIRPRSR